MNDKKMNEEKMDEKVVDAEVSAVEKSTTSSGTPALVEKKRRLWKTIALFWLVIIVVFVCVMWCMVYFFPGKSSNALRSWFVHHLPFPVAVAHVDGKWLSVPLDQYEDTVAAAKHFFGKQTEYGLSIAAQPTDAVLREQEYDRELELAYTEELAKKMNVTVSDEDVDNYFTQTILPQASSEDEIAQTLEDLYGWTVVDFKKNVLYPVVLRQKLNDALASDSSVDSSAQSTAEDVLAQVKAGEKTFEQLAEEYSTDTGSASSGGALGTFGKGVMVASFEEAAFALEVGALSELVKTQYGYHIIKLNSRDDGAGTVDASHILIGFETVDDRIEEITTSAKVYKMLPHYPVVEDTTTATENPYVDADAETEDASTAETNVNAEASVAE